MQERYEFLPGLWLISFSQYDFDGRKLFSGFSIHERAFYSNYRYIGRRTKPSQPSARSSGAPSWTSRFRARQSVKLFLLDLFKR